MVGESTYKNEWAVILGASSGLGLATAIKLASCGMNLCLLYRVRKSELPDINAKYQELIDQYGINILHFNLDAIKAENRKSVIANLHESLAENGKVKVLVHSIAKGNLKPMISDTDPVLQSDDFRLTIESMAISLYDWTTALFNQELFSADARIISFTSEGNTKAWKNYAAVSAAKVALEAITRSIALEFAPYGIKCNCIQAGITDTAALRMIPGHQDLIEHSLKRNPSGRLTTPQDVADVVYLLTRDEAKWITGTIIPVNGGEHLS
jgi:enoyl-[acyl-carrier protein] reductase I